MSALDPETRHRDLRPCARARRRHGRAGAVAQLSRRRADLRPDPGRVARGPSHLARDRHRQHRHLLVLDEAQEPGGDRGAAAGRSAQPACRSRRSLVLTDTARRPTDAAKFVAARRGVEPRPLRPAPSDLDRSARACCRSPALQGALAARLFGAPTLPVEVTLACSGADALALCLGAVLAYPVRGAARLAGAAGGAALILGLNTLRIGTLGRAAASPAWFDALHLYVWPARAHARDRRLRVRLDAPRRSRGRRAGRRHGAGDSPPASRAAAAVAAFVVLTVAFLLLFVAAVAALSRERRRARAGRLHRPRGGGDRSASSASARTPRPTCSGRRAAASSSRRSASPRR